MRQLDTSSVLHMLLGLNILHEGQNLVLDTRGNSQLFFWAHTMEYEDTWKVVREDSQYVG